MSIQKLNKDNFETTINNSKKLIMINFITEGSASCEMVAQAMEEMAAESDDMEIYKVDTQEEKELSQKYDVTSVPTIISFKDGQLLKREVYKSEEEPKHTKYSLERVVKIKKLNRENFEHTIKNSEKLIMIDFYADWCAPCQVVSKLMEEISAENGDIEVYKINIDEEPELTKHHGILSIPTVVSYRKGKVYKSVVGTHAKQYIMDSLMTVPKLNSSNLIKTIARNTDAVKMVYFYTDTSKACKMVTQVMEEIWEEENDLEVYKVNIHEQPEIAKRFTVTKVPTILSLRNGEVYRHTIASQAKKYILDSLMGIQKLDKNNFAGTLKNSKKLVIVDFYADWCAPCKMIAKITKEISEEHKDDIEVFKVNIDEDPQLAKKYSVLSIPTLISFKDGEPYKRVVGLENKNNILESLR